MSHLPQTLHSIRFFNRGTRFNPELWVEREYTDKNGDKHKEDRMIARDSSIILEYLYYDGDGETIPEKIVWE